MERISIFNYEAFYLDFLEGNLTEEDALLFQQFLDKNPELIVETDDFPTLGSEGDTLSFHDKFVLKNDYSDTEVNDESLELLLIAKEEGLLTADKFEEVNAYESSKSIYLSRLTQAVYLKPDTSIAYPDKIALKNKNKVVVWWYYSGVAAAILIAFMLLWNQDKGAMNLSVGKSIAKKEVIKKKSISPTKEKQLIKNKETNLEKNINNQNVDKSLYAKSETNNSSNRIKTGVDAMSYRGASTLASMEGVQLEPLSKQFVKQDPILKNPLPRETDVLAQSYYVGMQNPIEPITKFFREKTNKEVDFKTTKKAEGKRRGFFIKIGKFEFSRTRH